MINAFALLSLISLLVSLALGIIVYFKKVRYIFYNKTSKMFVLLCFTLAFCWALIEFGYRSADDFDTAYFWLKVNVLWYFVMSFLIHVSLLYTENIKLLKQKITYVIMYGPAVIFLFIDLTTNLLLTEPIKESWGWSFGIPANLIVHNIASGWAAFISIFCFYIILDYFYSINNPNKKKQTKFLIVGISIPILVGLNTEWFFPILGIKFPELLVPTLTIGLIIMGYGLWIYSPEKSKNYYRFVRKEIEKISKSIG